METATEIFSFQTAIFMIPEQTVAVKSLQHTGKLVLFVGHCNSLLPYLIFSSPLLCAVTGNGLKLYLLDIYIPLSTINNNNNHSYISLYNSQYIPNLMITLDM